MMKRVYLCGPIGGLTAEDAADGWRLQARTWLDLRYNLGAVSPMRGKDALFGRGLLGGSGYDDLGPMLTEQAVFKRDCNDVRTCDAVLAYFKDSPRVSIGSVWELGFATALAKPIVIVADKNHDHLFIRQSALALCETLEEAVDCLGLVLS
jgi:nucleoside 2-deoxyribosyltransferase